MAIGRQLAVVSQRLQRFLFPNRLVPADPVDHLRLQDEIASIDPGTIASRLLHEMIDPGLLFVQDYGAKTTRWLNDRHGGIPSVCLVERKEFRDVDVSHAVAICEAKGLVSDVLSNPAQAASRHRVGARV